jgi:hypothetical protein
MTSILNLFYNIASNLAIISLSFPIITDIIARKKNNKFSNDLKLFEFYIYFTFLMQLFAIILSKLLMVNNLIVFRIYLPIHTAILSYLLIKWLWNTKNLLWSIIIFIISLWGDYILENYNTPPNFMIWFDALLLLVLSFYLSYINDKKKIHLSKEKNYIHIGIYLYSIITVIGISPSFTELRTYGFFFQALATIISSYFFARSFRCLYRSNG